MIPRTLKAGTAMWAGAPALAAWAQDPHRPWAAPAQADWLYWWLALMGTLAFLAFVFWALYWRGPDPQKPSSRRYHALGALLISMALFTLALYLIVAVEAQQVPASDRAWRWAPGETLSDPGGGERVGEPYRGYQVYLAQGCTYCHTLYLRPEDVVTGWGEGARAEDVSQMGDFVHFPFGLLGTQRDGPDLTLIGRRIPDMGYQVEHLKRPRAFKPKSVMPGYGYLSERDLNDLAAFLVSLGNPPDALKAGTLRPAQPPGLDEAALAGQALYRGQGCVGCHSVDGAANVGPSWKGLYGAERALADGARAVADEAYLREAIRNPGAQLVQGYANLMPAYAQLTEAELDALVAYIRALAGE